MRKVVHAPFMRGLGKSFVRKPLWQDYLEVKYKDSIRAVLEK
jgi:hypothetical protein